MFTLTTFLFCALIVITPALNAPNGNFTEKPSLHQYSISGQVRTKRQFWESTNADHGSSNVEINNQGEQNEQIEQPQNNKEEQISISYVYYDSTAQNYNRPPPPRHHPPPPPSRPPSHWGGYYDQYHRPPPPPHDGRYPRRPGPPNPYDKHHPPPPPDFYDGYRPPPPQRHDRSWPPPRDHRPPPPNDHWPPPPPPYHGHGPPHHNRGPPPPPYHGPPHYGRGPPPPPSYDHDRPHHGRGPPPPPPHDHGPPRHDRGPPPPPPHDHGQPHYDRGPPPPPSYQHEKYHKPQDYSTPLQDPMSSTDGDRPPQQQFPPDEGRTPYTNNQAPIVQNSTLDFSQLPSSPISTDDNNANLIRNLKLVFSDDFKTTLLKNRQTFQDESSNNNNPTTETKAEPQYKQGRGQPLSNFETIVSINATPPPLPHIFQVVPVTPES